MKKNLFLTLLVLITICSCNKDDEESNYFKFKKNGEEITYSSFRAIDNVFKKDYTYIVAGYSDDLLNSINGELLQVNIKIEDKDYYNLQDSLTILYSEEERGNDFSAPKIYYDFSLENPYPDSLFIDKETTEFNLMIDEISRNSGIISGYFSGVLRNIKYNETDSIMITEGKFRMKLEINND